MRLSTRNHDRDNAGLTYVYPVVSRRAGGVSIGINLNPNNACNFRCVYCQVPGLKFGKAPTTDLALLEDELRGFLTDVLQGDYMEEFVPEGSRVLRDLAFSGNGEPTSSAEFLEVVQLTGRVLAEFDQLGKLKLVLITNGSLIHGAQVREALETLAPMNGEVWFKVDSATEAGLNHINDYHGGFDRVRRNLAIAARACPTYLQTCMFAWDGKGPSEVEREAYIDFVRWIRDEDIPVRGVLLYGLARQSHQPEAPALSALPVEELEAFGRRIEEAGLSVRVSP